MDDSPQIRQRATLVDVARLADVSARTVSRVYSDPESVSGATRQKVLTAAERLHFKPNVIARDLRLGGKSRTIAFATAEMTNPFYVHVAAGVQHELALHGYTMVLVSADSAAKERENIETLVSQRVCGVIFVPIGDDHSYLEGERHLGLSLVAVDRPARNLLADSVVLANRKGGYLATKSLIEHGHTRIAYVSNPRNVYSQCERIEGYRQAMAEHGLAVRPEWDHGSDDPDLPIEQLVSDLIKMPQTPTAIVSGNNRATIATIHALQQNGANLALVGFDELDLADVFGISVIAHDPRQMGRVAARRAMARLADPTGLTAQIEIPVNYLARGSGERSPDYVGAPTYPIRTGG